MGIPCCGLECMMLEKTMTVIYTGNSSHNVICGSNQGNCNARQKIPGVCATETWKWSSGSQWDNINAGFEVTVLPYIILHSDISKPLIIWLSDVYIMKGYFFIAGLLAQKLLTQYLEKSTAYQFHIINPCWKYDCILGQMGNADKPTL